MRIFLVLTVIAALTSLPASGLLLNGDFEEGDPPSHWSVSPHAVSSSETGLVRSGTRSMRIEALDGSISYAEQVVANIKYDSRYELSGWVWIDGDSETESAALKILWYPTEDGTGDDISNVSLQTEVADQWVYLDFTLDPLRF